MENMNLLVASLLETFEALGVRLSKPLRRLLAWLTAILLEGGQAHLHVVAAGLPDRRGLLTKMQRVRRFLSSKGMRPKAFIRPLLLLLKPVLLSLPTIELAMDRTDWEKRGKAINILTVAVVYKGRALPVYWINLGRKGASSFAQWQTLLEPVLTALQSIPEVDRLPIRVLGDREFASPKLAEWLASHGAGFTLRLKRSEYLKLGNQRSLKLSTLLQQCRPGTTIFFRQVTVTQDCAFKVNVLIAWPKAEEEPILLMSDLAEAQEVLESYEHRFYIEPMFKDTKTNAFDLEKGRMTDPTRLDALLVPVAFAYALSLLEGDDLEQQGSTLKPPEGKPRVVGLFLVGLREWIRRLRRTSWYRFRRFLSTFFGKILKGLSLPPQAIRKENVLKC